MAWNYSDNEYIKVYRRFVGWEWYQDIGTKVLFIHCLLRANWKESSWKGIKLEPGQFVTSLNKLSEETGLTVDQVRTALNHLKKTGEITSKSQSKFRIITVKNWLRFQVDPKPYPKQTPSESQADPNRYKKIRSKEDKKYIPPTRQEIDDYIYLMHYKNVDVDAFLDFNNSMGWKMDWHQALNQWVENQKKKDERARSRNPFLNFKQRGYDFEALERMAEDEDYDGSLEKYADDY